MDPQTAHNMDPQTARPASPLSSDQEGEQPFEDATTDMAAAHPTAHSDRSRSRSLISHRTSSSSTGRDVPADPHVPAIPSVDGPVDGPGVGVHVDGPVDGPGVGVHVDEDRVTDGPLHAADDDDDDDSSDDSSTKSPRTTHRISVTEDMDEVALDEESVKSPGLLPKLPPRQPSATGLQGFSSIMAPVTFPPPPPRPKEKEKEKELAPPPPTPAPMARKLTGPFAWLSRTSVSKPKPESPPLAPSDRRNTNASVATVGSISEFASARHDDGGANNRSSQYSLRDRFKLVRLREEAGITIEGEPSAEQAQAGALAGLTGRTPPSEEEHAAGIASGPASPTHRTSPSIAKQPTVNLNLAPGTASGFASGPAGDAAEPVDWDLWQNVVNEGPAAVARTSSEELNRAISNGIPQAIRGVIWQVMAQSKNEDLESLYRELVGRGTDKELRPPSIPNGQINGNGKVLDSATSSSSSVHSDYSSPPTTNGSNGPLPSPGFVTENPEDVIKFQAKIAAEKKQKDAAVQKLEKTIKRDLGARTSYSKYLMAAGLQDGLFGICKAYALYDESVGYAQGMNFIAMPLLFNMPEEEAFSLFVTLMNKYGLRDLFVHDMPGLHLHLYQFERLLEDLEPALYCHLHRKEVKPQLYATQWFLTLFAYRFPLQLVLRIYDLILSDGLGAILKFGIVLMQKNKEALLGMKDMSTLTIFLKERLFDVYIDKAPSASSILESGFFGSTGGVDKEVYRADQLVKDAVSVKVSPEVLKQYTMEWKEQNRLEKERETELHGFRDKAASLEIKVRQLERRAEQSDTEHVQMASELVRTKVENERLTDENEILKTKVEELQKIVETQPEEVEARLQSEMETVMQKNIVVHNENRALEEQMAEMEKELVATKMQWATINEDYETLKKKWSSVSELMKK